MADTDPAAAALDEIRGLASFADPGEWDKAGPRLLAMVDALLKPHRPVCNVMYAGDRCMECRDEYGDPVPFAECRARAAVLAGLTGEEDGNAKG